MKEKNVLLDTSFLKNLINIDELFPSSLYVRWVDDIVVKEFLLAKNGELRDRATDKMFFEKFNLHSLFLDFIVLEEYLGSPAIV